MPRCSVFFGIFPAWCSLSLMNLQFGVWQTFSYYYFKYFSLSFFASGYLIADMLYLFCGRPTVLGKLVYPGGRSC